MAFDSSGNIAEGMTRNSAAPWYGRPAQSQMRYMMTNIMLSQNQQGLQLKILLEELAFIMICSGLLNQSRNGHDIFHRINQLQLQLG
ncbi:MAG: hypothetical protein Ct9H300mP6_09970 [Gammaproteobacteria bacterium]|nr:MAG: hypothetical protein Ct9H300mP6_09970 [Gammaproteobacteria bacterium]